MKKGVLGLALFLVAVTVFGQTNIPAIVVSTFSPRGQTVTEDDAVSITELFIAELSKQAGVRVVDRTNLDRVLTEMRFQSTDWSNSQKTAQLGAALNAEFLVRGQINQLGPQISFALTALDIKTLEVVSSSTRTFSADITSSSYIFSTTSYGLFYQMSSIANGIADPIKTKMTELARQRQEEEQRREQESYLLVGKWLARGDSMSNNEAGINNAPNTMEITFYSDGTLYITLNQCWRYTVRQVGTVDRYGKINYSGGDPAIQVATTMGSGTYTRNGNKLRISWDENLSGTEYSRITTGSGRNASTRWVSVNKHNREQMTFDVTIVFSQNGRNMTWDRMEYRSIPSLFVRQ